jgi:hypothetical protein
LRKEIAEAVRSLRSNPGEVLHAIYSSPILAPCDAENVLIYNIGTAPFTAASRNGLRIERSFQHWRQPPRPSFEHHHSYTICKREWPFLGWRIGTDLLRWDGVPVPRVTTASKPSSIWYTLKSILNDTGVGRTNRVFGVEVSLVIPGQDSLSSAAAIVKPLLDGVIAALHAHDGRDLQGVGGRIAQQLSIDPEEVVSLLMRDAGAVLGVRTVVRPYRNAVQWYPDDESCVAALLTIDRSVNATEWRMSGRAFDVESVSANP